jgi:hypothetical protein
MRDGDCEEDADRCNPFMSRVFRSELLRISGNFDRVATPVIRTLAIDEARRMITIISIFVRWVIRGSRSGLAN